MDNNSNINDTWLVGLGVDVNGTEMMVHYLVSATDLEHAEAGVLEMGRTWWPSLKREDDRHRWEYETGVVWFNSIILLDDVENSILRGLKFLDAWTVTGLTDAPVLRDEWGMTGGISPADNLPGSTSAWYFLNE